MAAYGYRGRLTAAVSFDEGKWLEFYDEQIRGAAAFPPENAVAYRPEEMVPVPAEFPIPPALSAGPTVVLTGHDPSARRAVRVEVS